MVKKTRKKKSNFIRNTLLLVGGLSTGIFLLVSFSSIYRFLMDNAKIVLIVTGSIVLGLISIRILSPKKVKRSLFGSIWRFKA